MAESEPPLWTRTDPDSGQTAHSSTRIGHDADQPPGTWGIHVEFTDIFDRSQEGHLDVLVDDGLHAALVGVISG